MCVPLAMILALATTPAPVDAWLDDFFRPHAGRGIVAVAIVHDGQVTVRAYGAAPDSVFRMASLSKVVTAYAAVQLAKEGRLDLHARIPGTPVTPHHLLTHTSGIEDAFFGNTVHVGRHITLAEHFSENPPRFGRPPGREIVYSNEGIALLGRVIEQGCGLQFEQCVQRRVFGPLGMQRSTFVQPPPFPVIPSGAEGQASVQAPAGAMVSTAADMAKFLEALLGAHQTDGLFRDDIGGHRALFHTGRSGHESVLYLVPQHHLGLFVVHTGGMDRALRKRFVTEAVRRLLPAQPGRLRTGRPGGLRSGIYRPILFPRWRIEHAALLGADAMLEVDGDRATLRMPPFAMGPKLEFASDGYAITGGGDRVTVSGPLFEPVTFERIPWYASGRVQLAAIAVAALALLVVAIRRRGNVLVVVSLFATAPLAIAAIYFPGDAEQRPFLVEPSLRVGLTFVMLACAAALRLPLVAWRSRRIDDAIAAACAAAITVFLWYWNLLGWRF